MGREEPRTVEHDGDVDAFIAQVEHPRRRRDAARLRTLFEQVTGEPARMWGPAIVGFGRYSYTYDSGRSGEYLATGFSPRKAATTVYLMDGTERYRAELGRLGPHTTGKACLYLKDLELVDLGVLVAVVGRSFRAVSAG